VRRARTTGRTYLAGGIASLETRAPSGRVGRSQVHCYARPSKNRTCTFPRIGLKQVSQERGVELVLTCVELSGHLPAETARTCTSFTIFEGTSEVQLMISVLERRSEIGLRRALGATRGHIRV